MSGHPSSTELPGTLFHEHWWLAAATSGNFREVTVTNGGRVVGRLPFFLATKKGFVECRMPPFTHVLGPIVEAGTGKTQTQLVRRLSVIRTLIDQLPNVDFFRHALDQSILDGLAFQDRGFQVQPQYTFEIDCREGPEKLWAEMHSKVRQHIRRAEEKFVVSNVDDPQAFVHFYLENLRKRSLTSILDWGTFAELFKQSSARNCGEILSAHWPDGRPVAMTFLVWGHGKMYYLLSTRADDGGDNGSVNLLIWTAMKRAHERRLTFDLDGVSTSGTARFLSGFGGLPKLRLIVRRARFSYSVMQFAKRQLFGSSARETTNFT
jgi:lipid II:glycine glycyltransferase (peptidoglycan interpeptide bridge formation enzyme)